MRSTVAEVSASSSGFWTETQRFDNLDVSWLRQGLNAVEVACSAPRHVTLHVSFKDASLAPLLMPLDPIGALRYRKVFALNGDVRSASLELMPAGRDQDLQAVTLGPVSSLDLARVGWRAMRRHATSPGVFVAKARQAMAGGASLVFSATAAGNQADDEVCYQHWQTAFESEHEAIRLRAALAERFGPRPVKVLAIIAHWPFGNASLAAQLGSLTANPEAEIHVLDLCAADPRSSLAAGSRVASWRHHPIGDEPSLPTETVARTVHGAAADLVLFLERPGRFHRLAVPSLMLELALAPSALAAYADHDRLDGQGRRHAPAFKPVWSPDYLAAFDYIGQPVAFRGNSGLFTTATHTVSPLCPSFCLLMNLARRGSAAAVRHVPRILFHLSSDGSEATGRQRRAAERHAVQTLTGRRVESVPMADPAGPELRRVRTHVAAPSVSVIIPSKDNPGLLAHACRSVMSAARIRANVVIVDNGSTSNEQRELLTDLARDACIRVVSSPGPFNFSRLVNLGRANCDGEVLVLLNDDVESLDAEWLAEMATQAACPDVGAVGALLLYPDLRVQHAGVVLGINGCAGHAFRFAPGDSDGVGYRLRVVHEVAAVTAACLAVRTEVFDEVGGFADDLPVTLNDIDFCLKVRARGHRNLVTPHARLIHRESTSRGLDVTPERLRRLAAETAIFRRRWGDAALNDPFFSPHLSPSHEDYRCRVL